MSRTAVALLALCLCAQLACQTASAEEEEVLVYTEDFLKGHITKAMMQLPASTKLAFNGTQKKAPASPPKWVNLTCLNSVAPPPLNWKMLCPNKHANVTEWVDDVGSTHRKIVLKPIANMTAKMAVWFMTPAFPKTLNISGQEFTKHYLWHPLDHTGHPAFKLGPGKTPLTPLVLMSKLDETYRPLPGKTDRHYKTQLWVAAQDLAVNLPRNRYVLGMDVLGFQTFTLIVEFNDTPKGLSPSVEVILGAAAVGYDSKNPLKGTPKPAAAAANALLFETVMKPFRKNGDFKGALDAVTRHVVEEFGNLQFFVPQVWADSPQAKIAKELADAKAAIIKATTEAPGAENFSEFLT